MKRRLAILALLVVIIAAAALVYRRDGGEAYGIGASGTVEATAADLGFQAPGRIEWIGAREGDPVAAGEELARLDRSEMEARRAAVEAQVGAARALLRELERGARPEERAQASAAVSAARERLDAARRELERARSLERAGAVSRASRERAETAFEVAQSDFEQASEQLRLVERGPRAERIDAQRAVVAQAEAALRQVDATLHNAAVRAPFAGVVTVRHRQPGETVAAGMPVLTVLDRSDRWVRIYVPEDRIGRVSEGQPAVITVDSHPGRSYQGRVTFIASEAEFTPRNVQTQEERVRLVYAVKVAITGDAAYDLKVGTPADVRLLDDATSAGAS